ncbi:MAG: hypothetical protein LBT46_02790 [Planctomycetaceae bacterium]|jgi:hypothetical protein|nr:hypothetical protein [Planctomycetaceae bacterium]
MNFIRRFQHVDFNLLEKRAASKNNAGLYENGWFAETEETAWDAVREEQSEIVDAFGADEAVRRSLLLFREFSEAQNDLAEIAGSRLPPLSPWEIQKKLGIDVLKMRNQPTGDCVGNGASRAAETLLLDLRAQKFEIEPRLVHPSYCYAGARMLAGSRSGAGANVALAAKFMFENGVLFEDTPGVKSYDNDTKMSDRLGSRWDSTEMKELIQYAAPFRVTAIKLPSRDNMAAINLCLDAGAKIVGGFRRKFIAGSTRHGVKFGRLSGSWFHCVSILGRFSDPTPGYIWGNSHGNHYPGTCVLGTPAWALNLSPEDTASMCNGASLYALLFVQTGTNQSKPDWRPMPVV